MKPRDVSENLTEVRINYIADPSLDSIKNIEISIRRSTPDMAAVTNVLINGKLDSDEEAFTDTTQ